MKPEMTPEQKREYLAANTDELVIAYVTKYGGTVSFNGRMCARFGGVGKFYESIDQGGDDNRSNIFLDSLGSY